MTFRSAASFEAGVDNVYPRITLLLLRRRPDGDPIPFHTSHVAVLTGSNTGRVTK